ncbi:MAG: PAC2 family protein [Candidatus Omnitrophota bacterium]|jgi:hypothetical protein
MEGITVHKKPRLKSPYLIVAWPGMGEVAIKAATYLIEKLMASEFAEIPPEDFFYLTGSNVVDGILRLPELPKSKFYFWKNKTGKNDLIIFASDSQPDLEQAEEYCKRIISLAKAYKVKMVIGFAAMPQPIDHNQAPNVWLTATSPQLNAGLKKFDFQVLSEGQISGLNGLFLGLAKREGLDGICLLGEIPLYTIQIENPRASLALLETVGKIINLQIDFTGLVEQIHGVEEQINKLMDFLKVGGSASPAPINEEEIEMIRKSLSQLTKLPQSVKEKIEKLFVDAKTDISKAHQLKAELDKWNVYREYEDRFLDLFKKSRDINN